ncbi:MAG: hypothetical protein AAGJ81_08910 [Verrucomicrobiota bacterium]
MRSRTTIWLLPALLSLCLDAREWTNAEGQKLEAEYLSQNDETVKIRRESDFQIFEIPISTLSKQDQDFLKELKFNTIEVQKLRDVKRPSKQHFRKLLKLALEGNPLVLQIVSDYREILYEGIDYDEERDRVLENLEIMRSFFTPLGEAAGEGNDQAVEVLISATGESRIRSFTANAFGIGAGMGSRKCLEVLLNHKRYGLLLSSTVFALQYPAEQGNQEAIDFLAAVISDDKSRALWRGASQGLIKAANEGNETALKALDEYNSKE